MPKGQPKNMAASVRQRLLQEAQQNREDFQLILSRYALERLLYRLDQTHPDHRFVLKGAMLFQFWKLSSYRPTRDVDFLAQGDNSLDYLQGFFRQVCEQSVLDDGLKFQAESVTGSIMKADQEYPGVRIQLLATLERARIPVQIDIGFGDVITPGPELVTYPSLLGLATPQVAIYPQATVIAEKFQALVHLGMANSRMKDFFDLWILATQFSFSGSLLQQAIQATFQRRDTSVPATIPIALTTEFYLDQAKQLQWRAFLKKGSLDKLTPPFPELIADLQSFLLPILEALHTGTPFLQQWSPGGPWQAG